MKHGFIQPAKLRVAALILFREGFFCLYMNYRGFNAVCMENIYSLPLMKDLLAHLAKVRIFTKLDWGRLTTG